MLTKRIIPKLQLLNSCLVTTVRFDKQNAIEIGDPVSQAKIFEAQGADELVVLNIQPPGKQTLKVVRRLSEEIFMPLTVGGGIKTIQQMREAFNNGADKISINRAALKRPDLITEAALVFGSQSVVLSIDYTNHGGVVEWAVRGVELGAGEILLTCVSRDGTRSGLDLEGIRAVSRAVSVPVVASGGCGLASHFAEGFAAGAGAVAAGTYFCLADQNIAQVKAHAANAGVFVRRN